MNIGAKNYDDTSYLRYAHPTIREPFVDLLNLAVPAELEDQRLATLGYVDVTQKPFRADPTGRTDSTKAIQAAVVFARDHQMACFFPPGTYLLSDTLPCTQQLYKRANGRVVGHAMRQARPLDAGCLRHQWGYVAVPPSGPTLVGM